MRYHNISKDDFLNGDGIRAVLFVSGCTHACPKCHNPITWDKNGGLLFDEAAKAELFEYLENDYVTGITFSGGDPLAPYNREEVLALMEEVKEKFPGKTIWCYTGFTKDQLEEQGFWNRLKPNIDVLVEGEYVDSLRSQAYNWAGSKNQRILRAESDFAVNTSDPIYIAIEKLIHDLPKECAELSLANSTLEKIAGLLNPDAFVEENVAEAETISKELVAELSEALNDDVRKAVTAITTPLDAAFKERYEDIKIAIQASKEEADDPER